MKPAPLAYHAAASVEDAIGRLAAGDGMARVIAGGQSLVPMLNLRLAPVAELIDVTRIEDLRTCEDRGTSVRIGACITHATIQAGAIPDPSNGLMPAIGGTIAYQAVRNRGTIGGSLSLGDPSAEWLSTMIALRATVGWRGPQGAASSPASEFVSGAYTTKLDIADVVTDVVIPKLPADARWGFFKVCRKTGEYAKAMAVAVRARGASAIVLGATGGAPLLLAQTTALLDRMTAWDAASEPALLEAFDTDLAASGRKFSDVYIWQSRACVIRAGKRTFHA